MEKIKPIRGKIEDFFKLCKSGLSLKRLHKYTPESAKRTTTLIVFLAGLITTNVTTPKQPYKSFQKLENLGP